MAAEDFDEPNPSQEEGEEFSSENKIHVSRIPSSFDEKAVKRLLEANVGKDSVKEVVLIYKRPEDDEKEEGKNDGDSSAEKNRNENNKQESTRKATSTKSAKDTSKNDEESETEHRGFGFVTFVTEEFYQKAVELESVRGGRKATSSKKHTLYVRPYALQEQESDRQVCYLWAKHRCPYGDGCKFLHQGEGGCLDKSQPKKKQKCFAFKKGKCKKGDDCQFSHDFLPKESEKEEDKEEDKSMKNQDTDKAKPKKADSEKDCINWKTKGKCRKGDKCPYKHDESLRQAALLKKKRKKGDTIGDDDNESKRSKRGNKQPLWVRVFGLNYDTTQKDVRDFFAHCGPIMEVQFPRFDDSGRSKGYCGVLFQSPKAAAKALELDGEELMGRWLRVQSGRMLLDQWEEREQQQQQDPMGSELELHDVY